MHPFAELTNRTPSPSQKEDPNFNRKHSPWTAARHKKKTRSVQHQQQCSGDAVPVYQQVIPEAYNSPAATVKTAGVTAEYSLADGVSSGSQEATASPLSSPPVSKGSAQDAEVHPSKAYILDPKAHASPQEMELGSAGGITLAAAAAAAGSPDASCSRSPVWFCSNPLDDGVPGAAGGCGSSYSIQACSSAPACGNLFKRFDRAAQQQHQQNLDIQPRHKPLQQHHSYTCQQVHSSAQQDQQQDCQRPAQAPVAVAARGRRLTARRCSWAGGPEQQQQHRVAAASQAGPSRMAACAGGGSSSNSRFCPSAAEALDHQACSSWHQQQQQPALRQLIGGHSAAAAPAAGLMGSSDCSLQESDSGFQLRSRLSTIDDADTDIQLRRSIGSVLLQRWHRGDEGGAVDDWCCAAGGLAAAAGDDDRGDTLTHTTADAAAEGSALQWFEEEMLQAAEEGDTATAQQLWGNLQAVGLKPSRRFMNSFLMCCQYAGSDPVDAQEVVRDMCTAADFGPDSLTAQLLAAIDIGWQQLHCGV